jgi:hypothetical protein
MLVQLLIASACSRQLYIQDELAANRLFFEQLSRAGNPFGTYNPWQLADFRQRSIGISIEENDGK